LGTKGYSINFFDKIVNPECAITLVSEHGSENRQKIIDCLKTYLQHMPVHLKETKQELNALGFYKYEYNEKMQCLVEAKKRLYSERLKLHHDN
jgi:hypothetical protein